MQEKLKNPQYLAKHAEVMDAFKAENFVNREWMDFCYNESDPIFEFLNEEFINALSAYLCERIDELGATPDSPLIIAEIGAGNGRLTYFLQQKIKAIAPEKCKIIATDSGDWGLKSAFPVEHIDHKETLKKYQPKIVIYSWMPYGADMTADFRATKSTQEYILIGESDGGCCGADWETWGIHSGHDEDADEGRKNELPPFEKDGFVREDLTDISTHQICRTDNPPRCYHSCTISFKRRK